MYIHQLKLVFHSVNKMYAHGWSLSTINAMWQIWACFVIKKYGHSGLKFQLLKFGITVQIQNQMDWKMRCQTVLRETGHSIFILSLQGQEPNVREIERHFYLKACVLFGRFIPFDSAYEFCRITTICQSNVLITLKRKIDVCI